MHVLVVDDDPGVCDVIRHLLEDNGYHVSIAKDGIEMRRIASAEAVDLVILDAAMPGESGASLAAHADHLGIKVIMITGDPAQRQSVEDSGLPHILKPFHIADMLQLVSDVLQRATG